jgi:hypothetical protein
MMETGILRLHNRGFARWWKRGFYDNITGDSPDDGNGDSDDYITRGFARWWKWGFYDNITGDLPDGGNGDSTKKRANAIRPYEKINYYIEIQCNINI